MRTPLPASSLLRSKRPAASIAARIYAPLAVIAGLLIFVPRGPVFWGVLAAATLWFALFPALVHVLLGPLERAVLAATPSTAPGLLEALRRERRVRWWAPYAWTALQEGRLQLVRGEGRAAARALTEAVRLAGVMAAPPPVVVSAQAHALLLAEAPEQARDLLQSLVKRQAIGPWESLHLAAAQLLAGKPRVDEVRGHVEAAEAALGATPRVLATRALLEQRAGASEAALSALRAAEAGLEASADPLAQALVERARRLLRPAIKASEKRARKLEARAAGRKPVAKGLSRETGRKEQAEAKPTGSAAVKGPSAESDAAAVKGTSAESSAGAVSVAGTEASASAGVVLAMSAATPASEREAGNKTRGKRNARREERRAARRAAKAERRATQRASAPPPRGGVRTPAGAKERAPAEAVARDVSSTGQAGASLGGLNATTADASRDVSSAAGASRDVSSATTVGASRDVLSASDAVSRDGSSATTAGASPAASSATTVGASRDVLSASDAVSRDGSSATTVGASPAALSATQASDAVSRDGSSAAQAGASRAGGSASDAVSRDVSSAGQAGAAGSRGVSIPEGPGDGARSDAPASAAGEKDRSVSTAPASPPTSAALFGHLKRPDSPGASRPAPVMPAKAPAVGLPGLPTSPKTIRDVAATGSSAPPPVAPPSLAVPPVASIAPPGPAPTLGVPAVKPPTLGVPAVKPPALGVPTVKPPTLGVPTVGGASIKPPTLGGPVVGPGVPPPVIAPPVAAPVIAPPGAGPAPGAPADDAEWDSLFDAAD